MPQVITPVIFHHIHLTTTDPAALQAWYVKTFGAKATTRRNLPAAKIPGGEVDFLKAKDAPAPTKGRTRWITSGLRSKIWTRFARN